VSIIDPQWYVERTPEELEALREKFANKPANQLDVAMSSITILRAVEKLIAVVVTMDGLKLESIEKLKELMEVMETAQKVLFTFSTDDVVQEVWGDKDSTVTSDQEGRDG